MLLLSFMLIAGPVSATKRPIIEQSRKFSVENASCDFRVLTSYNADQEPDTRLNIRCDQKTVLDNDLFDAGVTDAFISLHEPTRLAVTWERGTGGGYLTVYAFKVEAGHLLAKVVYDRAGEVLDDGDVILEELGRRMLNGEWLPSVTNVMRWKGGGYHFERGFRWNSDASWDSRFCVLVNPNECPAEQSSHPLEPDDAN
ncbi:MAG TPA: hypothetical protein VK814_11535 [Acidobacteriaceae bacterium]|jgi:hypothetical protein|nr:hypothetical protein [Acidobacteriaceae bacterium]